MTGLNYLGIKKAGDFQLVFTVLKGILILIVAGFCFASASGSWTNFSTSLPHAVGGINGFMAALIATLWAYDGWNDLTMVAGEVRRPERSLPIALIGGLFIVGVLFMATNAAIQYILPAAQIAASERPAVAALSIVAGPRGAGFVAAAMAISIFVTLNGTVMSGARVPFAAARDRLFFRQFAHIHPRFQSPSTSLIVQGILSTVLLLFLSQFQQHFELAVFAEWLFYMLTATTVLRLSPPPARPGPSLPRLGISAAARHLRRLCRRCARVQLCWQPQRLVARHRSHPARPAGVVVRAQALWNLCARNALTRRPHREPEKCRGAQLVSASQTDEKPIVLRKKCLPVEGYGL